MQYLPVMGGPVPDVPHATPDEEYVPKGDVPVAFLNTVTYTCKEGYSLTGVFRQRTGSGLQ